MGKTNVIKFEVVGTAMFLSENAILSEDKNAETVRCKFEIDWSSISQEVRNETYSVEMHAHGMRLYALADASLPGDANMLGPLETNEIEIPNNETTTIYIFGIDNGEINITFFAQGSFSVIDGVACYDPDPEVLRFCDLKNALLAVQESLKELEIKTDNIQETLNGYTTE